VSTKVNTGSENFSASFIRRRPCGSLGLGMPEVARDLLLRVAAFWWPITTQDMPLKRAMPPTMEESSAEGAIAVQLVECVNSACT